MKRFFAINANGLRVGEDHPRAKLTDHDVDLIRDALDERDAFVAVLVGLGYRRLVIRRALSWLEMDVRGIARRFEVSRSLIQDIYVGRRRAQTVTGHRSVRLPGK